MKLISEALHGAAIERLRFHPREALLASVSGLRPEVCVWRFGEEGMIECLARIALAGSVRDVAWHPREAMLAVVGGGRAIDLWRPDVAMRTLGTAPVRGRMREDRYGIQRPGEPMKIETTRSEIPIEKQGYSAVVFSEDGTRLVASRFGAASDGEDPTEVYDVASGEMVSRFWRTDSVLARHPEGEIVATLSSDQGATAVRFGTLAEDFQGFNVQLFLEADGYRRLQFSPAGNAFAVVGNAYEIGVWAFSFPSCQQILSVGIETWAELRERVPPELSGKCPLLDRMAFAPNGEAILFGALDGSVKEIDVRAGEIVRSSTAHAGPVAALDVCSWQPLVATAGHDGRIRLWRSDGRRAEADPGRGVTTAFRATYQPTESLGDDERFRTTDGRRWYDRATMGDSPIDDDAPAWAQIAHWQSNEEDPEGH